MVWLSGLMSLFCHWMALWRQACTATKVCLLCLIQSSIAGALDYSPEHKKNGVNSGHTQPSESICSSFVGGWGSRLSRTSWFPDIVWLLGWGWNALIFVDIEYSFSYRSLAIPKMRTGYHGLKWCPLEEHRAWLHFQDFRSFNGCEYFCQMDVSQAFKKTFVMVSMTVWTCEYSRSVIKSMAKVIAVWGEIAEDHCHGQVWAQTF